MGKPMGCTVVGTTVRRSLDTLRSQAMRSSAGLANRSEVLRRVRREPLERVVP